MGRGKGILLPPVASTGILPPAAGTQGPGPGLPEQLSAAAAPHLPGAEDGHAEHQLCTFQWPWARLMVPSSRRKPQSHRPLLKAPILWSHHLSAFVPISRGGSCEPY